MIIERHNDEHEKKPHAIEKDIPNKWRREWLETKVSIPDPASKLPKLNRTHGRLSMVLKDHIRKVDIPGTASCILCSVHIEYTQGGLGTIKKNVQRLKHLKNLCALLGKQIIPGASMPEAENVIHGACTVRLHHHHPIHLMCHQHRLRIIDRVANMEAMVVTFLPEHSLSLILSDKLIELSLELSKDLVQAKIFTKIFVVEKINRMVGIFCQHHARKEFWRRDSIQNKGCMSPFGY